MNSKIKILATVAFSLPLATSCIDEVDPQTSYVTAEQAANAPGAYENFVTAITNSLCGDFTYAGNDNTYPWDFGYPSFFLQRDVMGQDMTCENSGSDWYRTWYADETGLGPTYAVCQLPWTYYYGWIANCNTVLSLAGENPDDDKKFGAGIAYAMRAMFYMDLARMYAAETYAANKEAETVPIITENTSAAESTNNPRATNEVMWAFILSDLDKAEEYLDGYVRENKYTPDQSVVYGLKARAYLTMEDWANAVKYAKLAQTGYTAMTEAEYLSQTTGFNTPNSAWMFGCTFKSTDPNIQLNDGDSSWGSQMIIEVSGSGCGYSANYVGPHRIDYHLFSTIGEKDYRRKCFVDFAIDELSSKDEKLKALKTYSDDPDGLYKTGYSVSAASSVGGMPVKFRPNGGEHNNQYTAFTVAVPLMRVEEMQLIEIEATGMQNQSEGITMLNKWVKLRDPNYNFTTETPTDAYYNTSNGSFQNEVWRQRRIELWGEGFATFDIKRLQKGIIRSYKNSNHADDYKWNMSSTPSWMTLCIVQSETNYNVSCTNNPYIEHATGADAEYEW